MKTFLNWVKSLSWIAIGGGVLAAVLMYLRALSAGKIEAEVAHGEAKIKELQKGSAVDIQAARDLQIDITAKKKKARDVRKKSEAAMNRIGQDETMADIAKRFNGKRVRTRSEEATISNT